MGPYHRLVQEEEEGGSDQEASPSARKHKEEVREITPEEETSWSLTLGKL